MPCDFGLEFGVQFVVQICSTDLQFRFVSLDLQFRFVVLTGGSEPELQT